MSKPGRAWGGCLPDRGARLGPVPAGPRDAHRAPPTCSSASRRRVAHPPSWPGSASASPTRLVRLPLKPNNEPSFCIGDGRSGNASRVLGRREGRQSCAPSPWLASAASTGQLDRSPLFNNSMTCRRGEVAWRAPLSKQHFKAASQSSHQRSQSTFMLQLENESNLKIAKEC